MESESMQDTKAKSSAEWARIIAKFSQNRIEAECMLVNKKNVERQTVTAFETIKANIVLSTKGPDVDARRAAVTLNPELVNAQASLDQAFAATRKCQLLLNTWISVITTVHELNALVVSGLLSPDQAISLIETDSEAKPKTNAIVVDGVKWTEEQKSGAS